MASLEQTLAQVEELRRDLSAEIVVGKHYDEGVWHKGSSEWGNNPGYYEVEPRWVEDYEPDTQKRESARQQLLKLYDSTKWYSVKYKINCIVGEYKGGIFVPSTKTSIEEWVKDMGRRVQDSNLSGDFKLEVLKDVEKLNDELRTLIYPCRENAKNELEKFLKECYACNPNTEIRTEAGKALGYSSLSIWAHENPLAATVSGLAVAGSASGLGYMLYQYFSR